MFPAVLALPALLALGGGTPPSEADCLKFAATLEQSLAAGDATFLKRNLDLDAILDRAMEGPEIKAKNRQAFRTGVKSSYDLPEQLAGAVQNGGSYVLLRHREVDGEQRLVFRMITDGGVNYHELKLVGNPNGSVRVTDLYICASGEWLSETLRRGYLPFAAEENKSFFERLTQGQSDYVKHIDKVLEMQSLAKGQRFAEAVAAFEALPPSLQKDKFLLLQRMFFAQQLDDAAYTKAMNELEAACPGDPCMDLIGIDSNIFKKRYTRAIKCIDRLDQFVGGDPYLEFLRANVWYMIGDLVKAKDTAVSAVKQDAKLEDAWWTLVTIALDQRDHPETARLLGELEKRFGYEFDDLRGVEGYENFVLSSAYRDFQGKRQTSGGRSGV